MRTLSIIFLVGLANPSLSIATPEAADNSDSTIVDHNESEPYEKVVEFEWNEEAKRALQRIKELEQLDEPTQMKVLRAHDFLTFYREQGTHISQWCNAKGIPMPRYTAAFAGKFGARRKRAQADADIHPIFEPEFWQQPPKHAPHPLHELSTGHGETLVQRCHWLEQNARAYVITLAYIDTLEPKID